MEFPILDDVGSFPLPNYISRSNFDRYYWDAYRALLNGYDYRTNQGLKINVVHPIEELFRLKVNSGMEIINYPQLMDMYSQFLKPLKDYENPTEPHLIIPEKAQILECNVLEEWAKQHYEETQTKIKLKLCITGPLEMYFKQIGFGVYTDLAMNFAKTVNAFLKNSLVDTPYIKTEIMAIDEPSLGYVTISGVEDDDLIRIYDKSVEGLPVDIQIHLHSLNSFKIPLQTKNINILTCEFASNPQNVIDSKYLEQYDKFMRVGICRTNFNAIMADALDAGQQFQQFNTVEGLKSLIDSPNRIQRCYSLAIDHYGDRLKYVGPDCGLSAWGPPEIATELLQRTCSVVKNLRIKK